MVSNMRRSVFLLSSALSGFAYLGVLLPSQAAGQTAQGGSPSNGQSATIETVTVTAVKRGPELLKDLPAAVTVLNTENLIADSVVRLQDYFTSVPGLSDAPTSLQSNERLSIRGVTTGSGTPTVGLLIDGIPYGSSTGIGGGQAPPDLDPSDLKQIDVLRGPQGTLYGVNSIGGVIDFETTDPSTEAFSGRLQSGLSTVYNGNEIGYNERAAVNVPLNDSMAVHASVYARQDPGWINNPVTGVNGVNSSDAIGGRLAGLWDISPNTTLKVSALYQNLTGGVNGADTCAQSPSSGPYTGFISYNYYCANGLKLGPLQQDSMPGTGGYDRSIQAYSAILTTKLGPATLTSLTGYSINKFHDREDISYDFYLDAEYYGGSSYFTGPVTNFAGTPYVNNNETDKFSQEIRVDIPIGDKIDWLTGLFYTHEDTQFTVSILAANINTGAINSAYNGLWNSTPFPSEYREGAIYTDLTYHVTDWLDVEAGLRGSDLAETATEYSDGLPFNCLFYGKCTNQIVYPANRETATPLTYLFTPSVKLTPDVMLYARLSSGFRAGGGNLVNAAGVPPTFGPDKTKDYEVGLKGDFLDHTLFIDASVYYIDWTDIQLGADATAGVYTTNGGGAKSEGVELEVNSRPWSGFNIDGWVALNDAQLTSTFPSTVTIIGSSGNSLPYTPHTSAHLTAQQNFPVTDSLTGFVGADASAESTRMDSFVSTKSNLFNVLSTGSPLPRTSLPGFAYFNLRAGVMFDTWTVNAYINNVADAHGVLLRGLDAGPGYSTNYITPRTIGANVIYNF
jgi:iron complex outermembrane recepter protein